MSAQLELVQGPWGQGVTAGVGVLCVVCALIAGRAARRLPGGLMVGRMALVGFWIVQGVALVMGAVDWLPKPTQSLSTGQRCTAVLPILLLHDERVLLLDQPEDHLDNAYVVETLVRSLRKRSASSQTIVATHNANIPVLADAQRVLVMGSDGRRGFVRLAAPLADPAVVNAISQVMEGGAEAFRLRAEFYAEHLADES